MRLDKFLVDCGVGSRSEVKQLLKQKKIAVNGKKETAGKLQIDPDKDQVTFMGEDLVHETFVYYLLNKPAGVISATEDDHHQTVVDLLDETARHKEVFPVGRLDIDTHGLLLLTNNGKLAHAMLSPKKHVSKIYRAQVAGIMDEADVARFEAGIALKDFTTFACDCSAIINERYKGKERVQTLGIRGSAGVVGTAVLTFESAS